RVPGTPLNVLQLAVLLILGLALLRLCMTLSRVIRAKWTVQMGWQGAIIRAGVGALLDASEDISSQPDSPPTPPAPSTPGPPRPERSTDPSHVDGVGPSVETLPPLASLWRPAAPSPALEPSAPVTATPILVSSLAVASSPAAVSPAG